MDNDGYEDMVEQFERLHRERKGWDDDALPEPEPRRSYPPPSSEPRPADPGTVLPYMRSDG